MSDPNLNRDNETAGTHLYEQVARRLGHLIEERTLRPGDRLPSIRKLREQQGVSTATVQQAYGLLECRGLIEARPQSGYYVRARGWTPPAEPEVFRPAARSTRVEVGDLVMEVIKATRDPSLIRLGASSPRAELFPTAELNRAMAAAGRRHSMKGNSYEPSPGYAPLRAQIARNALEAGCALTPDDIVITCGATEALSLCLRAVTRPGDTVGIESPAFFGILQMIESLGLRACEIPTHPRTGIELAELALRLKRCRLKACLFSPNISNPLGSLMPDEQKRELARLLARHEVPLIEDDIFGNLAFAEVRPKPVKAFDEAGWVLLCDSFTKTLAPGYRIGWVTPGRFKARVEYLKYVTTSATPTLPQMAIADFLARSSYTRHVRKLRHFHASQIAWLTGAAGKYFPAGTRVTRPAGGQVLWVELPDALDALELYRRALAERICIAPGPIFSPKRKFKNCFRLNGSNPWSAEIESAMQRLGELMGEMGREKD